MRVLYSCPVDILKYGAAGGHVISLVRSWAAQGHDVTLVYPNTTGASLVVAGVQVFGGKCIDNIPSREWALWQALHRCLQARSVDIVYHRFGKSSLMPLWWARQLGYPVILEVNSDLRSDLGDWSRLSLKLVVAIERMNCALASHIVAVSEGIRFSLQAAFDVPIGKISVVSNGVDLDNFYPRDRTESCIRLGLDPARHYVTFTGTFQTWQGVETIVTAAAMVHASNQNVTFLLVGDGPMRPLLQAQAHDLGVEEYVRFTGWRTAEETAIYLAASDVVIAPYNRIALSICNQPETYGALMKGSPLKIYSYLAAGRPVVASHFAEAGVLVEDIGAGIAVPPEDPESLARAILYVLTHPDEARAMGEAGRRAAEANYGWGVVAQRIAEICEQVRRP